MKPPASLGSAAEIPEGFIPLPHPLKQAIKDCILAFSMATWCFVRPSTHLLFDRDRYFFKLPVVSAELVALAANIFCLSFFVGLGIGVWRRSRSASLSLVLELLFLGLLIFPADYIRVQYFGMTVGGLGGFVKSPVAIAFLVAALAIFLWKHRLVARGAAVIISLTFPAAFWSMAKIVLLCLGVAHLHQCAMDDPPPPALFPAQEGRPRVLWIVFDETDFRLAFEKRPSGTALPEFDRLRSQSLFADHAYPPGSSTIISMPALITGRRLTAVEHDDCELALTLADSGATTDWNAMPSVFSEARELACNTALVGWYHPYSRVLGGSLNYCSWYAMPAFALARAATFGASMREQIASLSGHVHIRQMFIDICHGSLKDSISVATNPAYGLILLHLPPPHWPGVYLPGKNKFTCLGVEGPAGYFGNLVLADHELRTLRRAMEAAGQWDKTWVILSSDHWWRKSESYDGMSDHRVPFLVKSPGVSLPMNYSHQFNTVLTHDLILAILRGQLTNQAGVATLLDAGGPDLPVLRNGEGAE